jgi:hypothetical protein
MTARHDLPWLTERRWACLQAFKRQPHLMTRPFLAKEMIVPWRRGAQHKATGATMDSLRDAGWVQRVYYGEGEHLGFRLGRTPTAWQITQAGMQAVQDCPDIFPGDPVYGKKEPQT